MKLKPFYFFDGAFGTYYHKLHPDSSMPELANLEHKQDVYAIHRAYIESGATAIKTNTFGANPLNMPEAQMAAVLQSGYQIAVQAAGQAASVFADIGPISAENAADSYLKIAALFLAEGASHFLFETQSSFQELLPAIRYIKAHCDNAVVIVSFAVAQDGYTQNGEHYHALFAEAAAAGADYVGLNCICGPAHMLRLIAEADTDKYAVIAMPNSGYPATVNGRTVYVDNPDYFSDKLCDIYRCGVSAIGGCCGTTPAHIQASIQKIKALDSVIPPKPSVVKEPVVVEHPDWNHIMIAVEIAAPVDTDFSFALSASKSLKKAGADFITIPDSPLAKTRANSMMISAKIQREVGIPAIPHISCRDRNQIALKGDLIAGNIEGLREILAITGDPIPESERTKVKQVFGFHSYKLIHFISELNGAVFQQTPYRICAALNTSAVNFDAELKRAEEKAKNGAVCFLTQPLFSEKNIANYQTAKKVLPYKILAGIMPIAGYKNALFLNNEVPGIKVSEEIILALKDQPPEHAKEICLAYAKKTVDAVSEMCDGYYIMTPLKKIDYSIELVQHIRNHTLV